MDCMETAAERRQRWRSIYIIYFTMFQMSLGFSIVLTGVWPYLDKSHVMESDDEAKDRFRKKPALHEILMEPVNGKHMEL